MITNCIIITYLKWFYRNITLISNNIITKDVYKQCIMFYALFIVGNKIQSTFKVLRSSTYFLLFLKFFLLLLCNLPSIERILWCFVKCIYFPKFI